MPARRDGTTPAAPDALLRVDDLRVSFRTDDGVVRAVDHVSFDVKAGEVLGLVGESGCGKSVTCMSIPRLIATPPGRVDGGRIVFEGRDLLGLPVREMQALRGRRISTIFQEPMTALSPLHRIGDQLAETVRLHRDDSRTAARRMGLEWLLRVGIPDAGACMDAYPHQLSGGMRQRVMIAMALMLEPRLVIADEPTTALDVTIQAQVLDLMRAMKQQDTALLLVTHDMGVIWEMCTRVAVMYAAEIVETADVAELFDAPRHPYTRALLESVPALVPPDRKLEPIPGQVPSALDFPAGCRFRERCRFAMRRCAEEHPPLYADGARQCRCFLAEESGTPVRSAAANP